MTLVNFSHRVYRHTCTHTRQWQSRTHPAEMNKQTSLRLWLSPLPTTQTHIHTKRPTLAVAGTHGHMSANVCVPVPTVCLTSLFFLIPFVISCTDEHRVRSTAYVSSRYIVSAKVEAYTPHKPKTKTYFYTLCCEPLSLSLLFLFRFMFAFDSIRQTEQRLCSNSSCRPISIFSHFVCLFVKSVEINSSYLFSWEAQSTPSSSSSPCPPPPPTVGCACAYQ